MEPTTEIIIPVLKQLPVVAEIPSSPSPERSTVSEIVRFRRALGLPAERSSRGAERAEIRRLKTDEFLTAHPSAENKGIISEAQETTEKKAVQARQYTERLSIKEQIERRYVQHRLTQEFKKKGVVDAKKGADDLIVFLEQTGSPLIFDLQYNDNGINIDKVNYRELLENTTLSSILEIANPVLAFQRAGQLGYTIYNFHLGANEFVNILSTLSQIPEEKFAQFVARIDQCGFLIRPNELTSDYPYAVTDEFKQLIDLIKTGLKQDQITSLTKASRVSHLSKGQFRIVDALKSEFVDDSLVVLEDIFSRDSFEYLGSHYHTYLSENLKLLSKKGLLKPLADLIREGFVFGDGFFDHLVADSFSSIEFAEGKNIFIEEFQSVLDFTKDQDYEYCLATQEALANPDPKTLREVKELTLGLRDLLRKTEILSEEKKIDLLLQLARNFSYDNMSDFPGKERLVNITSSGVLYKTAIDPLIYSILLRNNGEFNMILFEKAVRGNMIPEGVLLNIVKLLPDKEKNFWGFYAVVIVRESREIADFLLTNRDQFDEYVKEGKFTVAFFDSLTVRSSVSPLALKVVLTDEVLATFPDKERKFWLFWRTLLGDELQEFIVKRRDNIDDFLSPEGVPTPAFFMEAFNINQIGMLHLLTDEVLSSFSAQDQKFWRLIKKIDSAEIRKFLLATKDKFEAYLSDTGEFSPSFFEDAGRFIGSSDTKSQGPLIAMLTEDLIKSFPESEQYFWTFWKGADRNLRLFLLDHKAEFATYVKKGVITHDFIIAVIRSEYARHVGLLLTDEVISLLPEEERAFWTCFKNFNVTPEIKELLIKSFLDPEKQKLFLEVFREPYFETTLTTYSDFQEGLLGKIAQSPELAKDLLQTINSHEFTTCFKALDGMIEVQIDFFTVFINYPEKRSSLLGLFSNTDLATVINDFTEIKEKLMHRLVSRPEIVSVMTSAFLNPDVHSFLSAHPNYRVNLINYLDNIPVEGFSIEYVLSSLVEIACATETGAEGLIKTITILGSKLSRTVDEILAENLESLIRMHINDDVSFFAGLRSHIKITPEQATLFLNDPNLDSETFHSLLFRIMPQFDLPDDFFIQFINAQDRLRKTDREVLASFITRAGGMRNLLENRSLLGKLVNDVSMELGTYIVQKILNMSFHPDGNVFGLQARSNPVSERSPGRLEGFSGKLQEIGMTEAQTHTTLKLRSVLSLILANEEEKEFTARIGQAVEEIGLEDVSGITTANDKFLGKPKRELDESAHTFEIYHRQLDRSRTIPDFDQLWRKKVMEYFEVKITSARTFDNDTLVSIYRDSLSLYHLGLSQYAHVAETIIPTLREVNVFLNERLFGQGIWFSGRDGIPMNLALKAEHFGEPLGTRDRFTEIIKPQIAQDPKRQEVLIGLALRAEGKEQLESADSRDSYLEKGMEIYLQTEARYYDIVKIASISRLVFENAKTEQAKQEVRDYLIEIGVTPQMLAVDTGYAGSVIKSALDLFGVTYVDADKMIALVDSQVSEIRQILKNKGEKAKEIEDLPKRHDRTLGYAGNKPIHLPMSLTEQYLSWVTDHAIIRHFAPRRQILTAEEASEQSLKETRHREIIESVNISLTDQNEEERQRVVDVTTELYDKSQEVMAPVFVGFADHLLRKVSTRENTRIIFAARDGIGPYQAALALLERFPERYPNVKAEQLVYAYFTRKVVYGSSEQLLKEYLQELGVPIGSDLILADIGMYGSIISPLRKKLADFEITDVEYVVSRTDEANGFIDDLSSPLSAFTQIVGNQAVHFIEDTYSGPIQSPTTIIKTELGLQPDTYLGSYDGEIGLKREYAIRAITDFVAQMESPDLDIETTRLKLNEFLGNPENFSRLMVPHER